MAILKTLYAPNSNNFAVAIDDQFQCSDETYKTELHFEMNVTGVWRGSTFNETFLDTELWRGIRNASSEPTNDNRVALVVDRWVNNLYFNINSGYVNTSNAHVRYDSSKMGSYQETDIPFNLPSNCTSEIMTISTNIPFFETVADYNTYITTGSGIENAINYKAPDHEQEGKEFSITNIWKHGTWTVYGHTESGNVNFRNVKGKMLTGGKISFYKKSGIIDGKLQYGVHVSSNFEGLEYSIDGVTWIQTDTFPFDFFYRERINELGEFDYGLSFNTIFPEWDSQEDSTAYIQGTKEINEAPNWNTIANFYPEGISNPTGTIENTTTFGEVYTKGFFSQMYLCNETVIQEISNDLFDYDVTTLSGLWADIKKGLEMYGTNPMDVVQGLRFYPLDLSTIFSNVSSQQYIYFGAYRLSLSNSIYKVIYANGYKDLGTVSIKRTFNDWRDFPPYTKLYIYLPYCGKFELEADRYYDKDVTVRYYIDLRTGACCACLIADGVLLDWFDGIIGTEMPITLTDYSSYAQNQLSIIMRNAGVGILGEAKAGNLAVGIMKSSTNYASGAIVEELNAGLAGGTTSLATSMGGGTGAAMALGAGALGAAGLVGGVAVGTAMKTSFDLMKNGTSGFTKARPSSSAMINQYLPQYPTFTFEIMEIDESPYLNELYGRPTNKSGLLGDFSGYLEVEDIVLVCPIATDSERQEIIDLCKSGIYI